MKAPAVFVVVGRFIWSPKNRKQHGEEALGLCWFERNRWRAERRPGAQRCGWPAGDRFFFLRAH